MSRILWLQTSHEEVNSLPGQDEYESPETFFANVDLGFAENAAHKGFHTIGPGRPPRKPLGLFRAFIVMRMKGIRSLREMSRLLNIDHRLNSPKWMLGGLSFGQNFINLWLFRKSPLYGLLGGFVNYTLCPYPQRPIR